MIAKVYSACPYGYEGRLIEVEGDSNKGLPAFNIVGMAAKTINESRERVRSALVNSGFTFPDRKITVNLAPADLPKDGAHLDLPIAISILILSKQLLPTDVKSCLFAGELSLDGYIRPVRGIINITETAQLAGFTSVYIPAENLSQASLIPNIKVIGVHNLQELLLHLKNQPTSTSTPIESEQKNYQTRTINLSQSVVQNTKTGVASTTSPTSTSPAPTLPASSSPTLLDHIYDQDLAKRALIIAIAGRHNLLISGPPGAGKTLLARAGANLLPPPSPTEQIAITKIHSLAGLTDTIVATRPFRTPHHTASTSSIIGGGPHASPGEISLAHLGILFLDELPEYPRNILEALRQPLEDRQITITRTGYRSTYPADFMLIATMNPCPCGYLGDPTHECTCTANQVEIYHKKLSGPLLDRIDLIINVKKTITSSLSVPTTSNLSASTAPSPSVPTTSNPSIPATSSPSAPTTPNIPPSISASEHSVAKNTITEAIKLQHTRYSNSYNGSLSSHQVVTLLKLTPSARQLLTSAAEKLDLSARSYFKVIKIARTIADLELVSTHQSPQSDIPHPNNASAPSVVFTPNAPSSNPDPHTSSSPNLDPHTPIDAPHIAEALSFRHQLFQ